MSTASVAKAMMVRSTGDLRFRFDDDLLPEVFKFAGFEIWAVIFPDGSMRCPTAPSIDQILRFHQDVGCSLLPQPAVCFRKLDMADAAQQRIQRHPQSTVAGLQLQYVLQRLSCPIWSRSGTV
jgi:hypothetical protein